MADQPMSPVACVRRFLRYTWKFWVVFAYYSAACGFFMPIEGWSALETSYFITATITTVGYGDVAPKTHSGRLVAFAFILFGLSVVFVIIANVATNIIEAAEARAVAAVDNDLTDNKQPHMFKVAMSFFMIGICVIIGGAFYYFNGEFDGDLIHCFWWSAATVTTVGYGDLAIHKESSKAFTIAFMLGSVLVTAAAIGNLSSVRDDMRREKREADLLERLDPMLIREFDSNGDGIDVNEYVIGMLLLLEEVDPDKVKMYHAQFQEHDRDKSGVLDRHDLAVLSKIEAEKKLRRQFMMQGDKGEDLEQKIANAVADMIETENCRPVPRMPPIAEMKLSKANVLPDNGIDSMDSWENDAEAGQGGRVPGPPGMNLSANRDLANGDARILCDVDGEGSIHEDHHSFVFCAV